MTDTAFKPYDAKCYDRLFEKFQYLFEAELIDEICRFGKVTRFPAEHVIIDLGDKITNMPLVINGSVRIMTEDEEGRELLLYYLELGDTCAMTLNCCSRATKSNIRAITEEPCEIIMVPVEYLDIWMVKFKKWRNFVLESYNTRLNEMLEAIDNLAFHNMEDRIIKYLRDKAMVLGDEKLKITHFQIARDLNSSRVVISRLMKKLEDAGELEQSRNMVKVKL
ncbi:MAG: Crp/Fnr family transcriptional regulator [Saprospiraceae bacterium]|nr:Crp/Fnr family transcriptional regulator [Saprospiraceae bacterium]